MWVLGVAVTALVVWEVLRYVQSAQEPPVQHQVCVVCRESGVPFGQLQIAEGHSTFVLRDRDGQTCFILEADLGKDGRLGIRDEKGQWQWYPVPPPEKR
jgi:hypothetical protein